MEVGVTVYGLSEMIQQLKAPKRAQDMNAAKGELATRYAAEVGRRGTTAPTWGRWRLWDSPPAGALGRLPEADPSTGSR
jgi:hypothetical protein